MLKVFLIISFGIIAASALLGGIFGFAIATQQRKKGATIGAIVGLIIGSVLAPWATFEPSPPREVPTVIAE